MADTRQLVKFGAIGFGGYLLWQIFGKEKEPAPEIVSGGVQRPTTPVVARDVDHPETSTPSPAQPPTVTVTPVPAEQPPLAAGKPDDSLLMRAATNRAWTGPVGSYAMTIDQWNWYRNEYQKQVIHNPNPDPGLYQPSLDDVVDPAHRWDRITVDAYHSLLARKGLEGLGAVYGGHLRARTWHQYGRALY